MVTFTNGDDAEDAEEDEINVEEETVWQGEAKGAVKLNT